MSNKTLKIIIALFIAFFILSGIKSSIAVSNSVDSEIEELNQKIQNQKKQIDSLKAKQKEYQIQIEAKRKDQVNLNNQLSIIENRINKAELDIEGAILEIDKTNLEIKKVEIDSVNLDEKMEEQKIHISNILRLVYKQDQTSALEMLLLNNSLTDFLSQVKYLEDTNSEISESVEELKSQKEQLDRNKATLENKNKELEELRVKLEEKKNGLAFEQENKIYILEKTKSSEREFQSLLAQAKREQDQAQADINNAERLIREKMSQKDKDKLNNSNSTIYWPVKKSYITSTFHDPDYPYRTLIGEHSGVDIRAAQGSTLMAAADGYVAKVNFNGSSNYAYIMIIHADGLATVYGHISASYVSVDQYVTRGQVIGRTGGTPGTPGSGRFVTGPHLHFEVRKNGMPVNPLNYLP